MKNQKIHYDTLTKFALEQSIDVNYPVLMIGETGCGKTSFIRDIANQRGIELIRLNLTGQTGVDEILGKYLVRANSDGANEMYWMNGLLVEAMEKGYWIVFDEINMCVDKTTECLTSDGWKKYNELSKDDLIATLNPKTNNVEYHKPNDIKIFNYKGDMIKFSGRYHEQLITPNHRIMIKEKHIAYDKSKRNDIKTQRNNYKTVVDKDWKFKRAIDMKESYSGILIPTAGYINSKRKNVIGELRAELLGWIITDGHLKKGCDAIEIYQSYSGNREKFEHISNLLDNIGIDYSVSIKDKKTILAGKEYNTKQGVFYLKSNSIKWIKNWINKKKEPSYDIFNKFSRIELDALFRGMILGDGDTDKNGKSNLTCGNEKVVNWFQSLLLHIGKGCSVKKNKQGYWRISINNKLVANLVDTNKIGTKSDYKKIVKNYDDIVWCLNIKNSNFLIRKKDATGHWKTSFTGNCLPEILSSLHSLLDDDRKIVLKEKDGSVIRPHERFRFFATMNPSDEYVGTKELNKAFLSRFPVVMNINYSENEAEIISERTGMLKDDADKLVLAARQVREYKEKEELTYPCSTRDLLYCAELITNKFEVKNALELAIFNKVNIEEREKIKTIFQLVTGENIDIKLENGNVKSFKTLNDIKKLVEEADKKEEEMIDKENKFRIKFDDIKKEIIEFKDNAEKDKKTLQEKIIDLEIEKKGNDIIKKKITELLKKSGIPEKDIVALFRKPRKTKKTKKSEEVPF